MIDGALNTLSIMIFINRNRVNYKNQHYLPMITIPIVIE